VADQGATTRRVEGQEEVAIPVVEEDISIGKREVERGHVRVFSRVTERPVEESVRLREEKVTVERRPVDRPATDADFAAAEKEVIEITETAEEPVVSKRARVVEEVVVHKEVTERTETVRGTERYTDVDVQREPETATATRRGMVTQDFTTYDPIFRKHYATAFAGKGATYTEYEPAYRYGYELSTNERYRGRTWDALEADARRDWEARHPSTWELFKDAIRYGWESLTGNETGRPDLTRTMTRDDFTTYNDDFRKHYVTAFGDRGAAYTDYEPAYRYGYELGTNERYRGRDWVALEADARRDWEARHPSTWERFKDAIRYGWESLTGNETERSNINRTMDRKDFTTYNEDFRKHYVTAFGDRGAAYTDYEPAYRYGYELGTNERYRGRDWVALEADARRDWEVRHPSTWERFKDAIRYGWDKVHTRP
jgi:uncharacterized protein (TIGR02271 family)